MDDRVPPHELRGAAGQVIDPGGGFVPGLAPSPLPYAAQGTPGLATAAAAPPPGAPTPASEDPASMVLALAQLAGEMFGGSSGLSGGGASVIPVPSPASVTSGSGMSMMASPGISPMLVGAPPPGVSSVVLPAGAPTDVTALQPPQGEVAPAAPAAPVSAVPAGAELMTPAMTAPPSFGAELLAPIDAPAAPTFLPLLDLPAPPALGAPSAFEQPPVGVPMLMAIPSAFPDDGALTRDLGGAAFDPYVVRRDFPILEERVHGGKRLVWLDNAATTQKPRAVIDRISYFYEHENSNIHRAAHALAARATDAYEASRETTRKFLNAPSTQEIIFVRGATEGINLVAQTWGRRNVGKDDEIVITWLEHHANIVPWQMLCAEKGARLRVAPVDDRGDVILEAYERLLGPRTKLVAIPQVSNALGTITPTREMVEMAHRHGARVLVDGAQAVSHMHVDVQELDCDFYVFSGHKVFAPTGIGVVFGKRDVLEHMPPWQGGGNMISDVTFEKTQYQPPPGRFEAGTGNIADAVGLGAALEYVMRIGMHTIDRYEHDLLVYATERLLKVPGLHMIGTAVKKAGVLSFVLDGQRTEDVGGALDKEGIAVRSGHHCAQPILRRFGHEGTVRASLAFYNVCEDIDALVEALMRLQGNRAPL